MTLLRERLVEVVTVTVQSCTGVYRMWQPHRPQAQKCLRVLEEVLGVRRGDWTGPV